MVPILEVVSYEHIEKAALAHRPVLIMGQMNKHPNVFDSDSHQTSGGAIERAAQGVNEAM